MIFCIEIDTAANDKMCNFKIMKFLYVSYESDPNLTFISY